MRIDDISISRVAGVAPSWKVQVEIAGGQLGSRESFCDLDGLLYDLMGMSVTLAALAGKKVEMPARATKADARFRLSELSLVKSPVHASAWKLTMAIGDLKYDGWFSDFEGFRTAIQDATVFYAHRLGKISLEAANRSSTRDFAPGVVH